MTNKKFHHTTTFASLDFDPLHGNGRGDCVHGDNEKFSFLLIEGRVDLSFESYLGFLS